MPYIADHTKAQLDHREPVSAGELTYAMQQLVNNYLLVNDLDYMHLSIVLGSIEGLKADFIDRIVMPYEAIKAAENGDVWDTRLWNR